MRTTSLLKAKIQSTTLLSGGSLHQLRERDQLWVLPLAVVGILAGAAGIVWMLFQNYRGMAMLGAAIGVPELPFFVGVLVGWVLILVVGVPVAISVLFFSRDTAMLAALPLRPGQIVAANIGLLYLYAVPVAVIVMVPATVAVAGVSGATVLMVVSTVCISLALPLVPLAITVLFVTGVARLVNLSRYRTALEAGGMVLLVVGLVGFQWLFSRSLMAGTSQVAAPGGGGQAMQDSAAALAGIAGGLAGMVSSVPPVDWVARSFLPGGAPWLLLSLAMSVAAVVTAGAVVQSGYLRLVAIRSAAPRRRHGTAGIPPRRSVLRALVGRELHLLGSNSTFLFETAGEVVIFPIVLGLFGVLVPGELMDSMRPALEGFGYAVPALLGGLLLFAGINTVSSSALSREGRSFDLSLAIPVPGDQQVRAKIATYLVLFWPAFILNAGIATAILRFAWWTVPLLGMAGLPFLVLLGSITIYADIRRPVLNWSHPQQAVKQNMNVVVGMGLSVVSIAAAGAPAILGALRGYDPFVVLGIAVAMATIGAVVVYRLVGRYAARRYHHAFSTTPG